MRGKRSSGDSAPQAACDISPVPWPPGAHGGGAGPDLTLDATRQRVARLARTIESEVIPRLVEHHRDPLAAAVGMPSEAEVARLVTALVADDEQHVVDMLRGLLKRGVAVESLYMDWMAPAARRLGVLWEQDRCDFATVTVGLGRLQRLLRMLSPAFGNEVQHPTHGRRVLLTQPDDELHMFGLAMVAEFFRRDGWDVLGGVAGVGIDAVQWVRRDWFDAAGFSLGNEARLGWLRDTIAALRQASRNRDIVVLVGGPLFALHPDWADQVGADATSDGRNAPAVAESISNHRLHGPGGLRGAKRE